jgi:hypothetical protein
MDQDFGKAVWPEHVADPLHRRFPVFAQVSTAKRPIASIPIASNRSVHIIDSVGKEFIFTERTQLARGSSPKIPPDRRTVGWLVEVEYENCCSSIRYLRGWQFSGTERSLSASESGQPIGDWEFRKAGNEVAFCSGPMETCQF